MSVGLADENFSPLFKSAGRNYYLIEGITTVITIRILMGIIIRIVISLIRVRSNYNLAGAFTALQRMIIDYIYRTVFPTND